MPEHDWYNISLKLFLHNAEGKLLFLRGTEFGLTTDKGFDIPGGRVHADERDASLVEILKREVKEELGEIQYTVSQNIVTACKRIVPAHIHPSGEEVPMIYLFLEGEYKGGEIRLSHEHEGYLWLYPQEVDVEKNFVPGFKDGIADYLQIKKIPKQK